MAKNMWNTEKTAAILGLMLVMILQVTFSFADETDKNVVPDSKKMEPQYVGKSLVFDRVVDAIALSPDGRWLAVGYFRQPDKVLHAMQIWDGRTFEKVTDLKGHCGGVHDLAYTPDGKSLVSTSGDGTLSIWDVGDWPERLTTAGFEGAVVKNIVFSKNGKWLNIHCSNNRVYQKRDLVGVVSLQKHGIVFDRRFGMSIAKTPISVTLATSDESVFVLVGKITRIWSCLQHDDILSFPTHKKGITDAVLVDNDETLVTSGKDRKVHFWNLKTGKLTKTIVPQKGALSLAYCAVTNRLAVGGDTDGTIQLYDATSRNPLQTLTGLHGGVKSMVFSNDGTTLIAGGGRFFAACLPEIQQRPTLQGERSTLRVWSIRQKPVK